YLFLLDLPDLDARDLSALEACLFAGMPMPRDGVERLHRALPHVRLIETYGQTEAGGGTIIQGEDLLRRPGSGGRPLPAPEGRLAHAAGRERAPGTRGGGLLPRPGDMGGHRPHPAR